MTTPLCLCILAGIALRVAWTVLVRNRKLLPPEVTVDRGHADRLWEAYTNCSCKSIFSATSLHRSSIIINDISIALELFEKVNFSDKPPWPMAELLGRQDNVGFQNYGERLRCYRKLLHMSFNHTVVIKNWAPLIEEQTRSLIRRIAASPNTFYEDVETNIQELIVRLAYGTIPNPEYLALARKVQQQTSAAILPANTWVVNLFPERFIWLLPLWFPGSKFLRWTKNMRLDYYYLTHYPFGEAKQAANDNGSVSFVQMCMRSNASNSVPEDAIISTAGSLLSAGTETMEGFLLTFFALMQDHPEVQDRAYAEICAVVGNEGRLPELQDLASLCYVDCIIQEIHRFNPMIPLVAHSNAVEEEYIGYTIPPKSWLIANIWAMLHDENNYPQANDFLPERFIPLEGKTTPRDPRTLVFGFGRRVCPGQHFANAFNSLMVARLLASFKISPNVGSPSVNWRNALVPAPEPFQCCIVSRGD